MEIITWDEKYKNDFKELSLDWLNKYDILEKSDEDMLENPEKIILKPGGMIFFAKEGNEILGTAALSNYDDNSFELIKVGVKSEHKGKGVGSALMKFALKYAQEHHAKKVILHTHKSLKPAIHMYQKFGFRKVEFDPEDSVYDAVDMKMELKLNTRKNNYIKIK